MFEALKSWKTVLAIAIVAGLIVYHTAVVTALKGDLASKTTEISVLTIQLSETTRKLEIAEQNSTERLKQISGLSTYIEDYARSATKSQNNLKRLLQLCEDQKPPVLVDHTNKSSPVYGVTREDSDKIRTLIDDILSDGRLR